MDFRGQKQAEQLCMYIIIAAGVVAFVSGFTQNSFALMMKVRPACHLSAIRASPEQSLADASYKYCLTLPDSGLLDVNGLRLPR